MNEQLLQTTKKFTSCFALLATNKQAQQLHPLKTHAKKHEHSHAHTNVQTNMHTSTHLQCHVTLDSTSPNKLD